MQLAPETIRLVSLHLPENPIMVDRCSRLNKSLSLVGSSPLSSPRMIRLGLSAPIGLALHSLVTPTQRVAEVLFVQNSPSEPKSEVLAKAMTSFGDPDASEPSGLTRVCAWIPRSPCPSFQHIQSQMAVSSSHRPLNALGACRESLS